MQELVVEVAVEESHSTFKVLASRDRSSTMEGFLGQWMQVQGVQLCLLLVMHSHLLPMASMWCLSTLYHPSRAIFDLYIRENMELDRFCFAYSGAPLLWIISVNKFCFFTNISDTV